MTTFLTPDEVEKIAASRGRSMTQVCRDAGVAPSTFTRWKRGETSPTISMYEKIVSAARAEVGEAQHAAE